MRKRRYAIVLLVVGLFYLRSDTLANWSAVKKLSKTPGMSFYPAIAVDSNDHIHVVWYDDTSGNWEIYYMRSTDKGKTWGEKKELTQTSGFSFYPAMAIDSKNRIHVVWCDSTPGNDEIYYIKSTDGGTTWSKIKRLTHTSGQSWLPCITTDSMNHVHVVWEDTTRGNKEIYYMRSMDKGKTWSKIKRLSKTSSDSLRAAIAVDLTNILHVVWMAGTLGNTEIYYRTSINGGTTWSAVNRLTATSGWFCSPDIAVDKSNTIHLIWGDYKLDNGAIDYMRSPDGGTTWSETKRLSENSGDPYSPAIAIDSNDHIHIVSGLANIYYLRSRNGGTTWSAAKRLAKTPSWSYDAALAIDSSNTIHVVWTDETPGPPDIYYRKGK